jgi:hypothetical protein
MNTTQTATGANKFVKKLDWYSLRTVAICLALALWPVAYKYSYRVPRLSKLNHLYLEVRHKQLDEEDLNALAAGYYEDIESKRHLPVGDWAEQRNDYLLRDDLLRYEMKANLNHAYGDGIRFTNSRGMANPEYGPEKPPHTWRIALMGDSVSLGPYGHSYDQLLEHKLNDCCTTKEIEQYQVLNFSVPGYLLIQKMDVAIERAKQFHPDVYVVAITSREKGGLIFWLAGLNKSGVDLKYDFLKKIETQAGVKQSDSELVVESKLMPFREQITLGALEQVRMSAQTQGARTVVFLVPFAEGLETQETVLEQFDQLVATTGIPVVDLSHAYDSVADLTKIQIDPPDDKHPNIRGNELIFDELDRRLRAQPDAMKAILGR